MPDTTNPLNNLMGETLARRKVDPRYRASVARGLDQATEHYAYPWVLRFAEDKRNQTSYLRAAGLAAAYPEIEHGSGIALGVSLRRLSMSRSGGGQLDLAAPDLVASRLATLHEQDLEPAVSTIRRFLQLARDTNVKFDFIHIAWMLARWGHGFTDASQTIRQRTIGDYYGAWSLDSTSATPPIINKES